MASHRGRALRAGIVLLIALALRPVAAEEKLLLEETFAGKDLGSRPGPWLYFTDEGNDAVVAEAPGTGGRCLKITRTAGIVWKPMITGWVEGEPDSPVRLDLDWFLPTLSDGPDQVLFVSLRGSVNINYAQVALGGPGGVAVPQGGDDYVPLGFPIRAGQWGHLTIIADPVSRKADGAFDLILAQGKERGEYPNIPFRPDWRGDYPQALWYTPVLHVGGGSPEHPREACVTNVRLTTTSPRTCR